MTSRIVAALVTLSLITVIGRADGPADNLPEKVRPVPKSGIAVAPEVRKELEAGLAELQAAYDKLASAPKPPAADFLADVLVLHKAVRDALVHQEFFEERELNKARELLNLGRERAKELAQGKPSWAELKGLVVRGYVSKIDGSVQPYGLIVPESYSANGTSRFRLDVWFHGRGETLSEVNFLDQRRKTRGEFAPADTIVIHPYGRYCNAFKFAGEVDVLEAIEAVKRNYRIDDDRIAMRGFSMGGAAAWHFAVHYPDRWFAANPGAGFSETPRFLKVFQRETLAPTSWEQTLWNLYDCDKWAINLAQCPTVAYSGELDSQKQAADVMAEALKKEGIDLVHIIGPQTKHAYHPQARVEVDRRLASLANFGRQAVPGEVHFVTYTLKYNRSNWVTVDRLDRHWDEARVDAAIRPGASIRVQTKNVRALTLNFEPGESPFSVLSPVMIEIDGTSVQANRPASDRSWSASLVRNGSGWSLGSAAAERLVKRSGLQGPIDDAFMDSFVFVKPSKTSTNPKVQAWVDAELPRAIAEWRKHFRGDARVINDVDVTPEIQRDTNLILWGDAESNSQIRKLLQLRLPFAWDTTGVRIGENKFDAADHVLLAIYPNPERPNRYVVLNSGFTFREYDYLNNARQVPKLPDWAVIDIRTPPNARYPGKVVAADFFDENWGLRSASASK